MPLAPLILLSLALRALLAKPPVLLLPLILLAGLPVSLLPLTLPGVGLDVTELIPIALDGRYLGYPCHLFGNEYALAPDVG